MSYGSSIDLAKRRNYSTYDWDMYNKSEDAYQCIIEGFGGKRYATGSVYMYLKDGCFKLGYTKSPVERFRTLSKLWGCFDWRLSLVFMFPSINKAKEVERNLKTLLTNYPIDVPMSGSNEFYSVSDWFKCKNYIIEMGGIVSPHYLYRIFLSRDGWVDTGDYRLPKFVNRVDYLERLLEENGISY